MDNPRSTLPATGSPLLLGIGDACRTLGIGRSTLFTLLRDGRLPACKVGRRTLIPYDSLRDFLAGLPAARFRPVPSTRVHGGAALMTPC